MAKFLISEQVFSRLIGIDSYNGNQSINFLNTSISRTTVLIIFLANILEIVDLPELIEPLMKMIILERWTGFEPATFSLARRHSTAELPPRCVPGLRIELRSQVFQTRAVTDLATLAIFYNLWFVLYSKLSPFLKPLALWTVKRPPAS